MRPDESRDETAQEREQERREIDERLSKVEAFLEAIAHQQRKGASSANGRSASG